MREDTMCNRLVLLAVFLGTGSLAAQGSTALYTRWNALAGFEYQRYSFADSVGTSGSSVKSVSQWSIPIVVVAPVGRQMSVDITTHVVHNTISGASSFTFTGLTDTQLRLLYTLSRDRAVASLSLNLPTGTHSFSTDSFVIASSVSSPYLSFPVSSLGTGFGVTAGLAYTVPAGGWNLGVAGSVRYTSSYDAITNPTVTYNPGLEGRLRLATDRLVGQRGRILLGATYSTFSTDQFSGSGIVSGWFNPGTRIILDAGYAYVAGRTTVVLSGWDFYRSSGTDNGNQSSDSKENVLNAELRVGRQLSPRVVVEPLAAFRQWSPGSIRGGRLYMFGANTRIGISDQVSATVSGRFATGWVISGARSDLTGTGLTVLLRYQR
jgi:hypothetical protein